MGLSKEEHLDQILFMIDDVQIYSVNEWKFYLDLSVTNFRQTLRTPAR